MSSYAEFKNEIEAATKWWNNLSSVLASDSEKDKKIDELIKLVSTQKLRLEKYERMIKELHSTVVTESDTKKRKA